VGVDVNPIFIKHTLAQAGHLFSLPPDLAAELPSLLRQHSLQDIQTRSHTLKHLIASPEGQTMLESIGLIYRNMVPFMRKWTQVPEDYE
jgi:hypothetical protein